MTDLVTVSIADGIADVRFNRPDKHNSLTLDMFGAINDAARALYTDPRIRVAVLSGNGPSFCAGLDFSIMQEMLKSPDAARAVMDSLLARDAGPDNRAQRTACAWKYAPSGSRIAAARAYGSSASLDPVCAMPLRCIAAATGR